MRRRIGGLIVGVLLAPSPSVADPFDTRLEEARANEATPEWKAYSGPFLERLGPVLQRATQRCFSEKRGQTIDGLTILFAIQGDGRLADLMVRPDIAETACVINGIRDVRVPTPPRPNWWEFLKITVTP